MSSRAASAVHIHQACRRFAAHAPTLRRAIARICRDLGVDAGAAVHVVLCSDRVIRRLNATYRHIDRPTDVLSFHYGEADLLGELYISLERAAVQARRYGHSLREELQRLAVHGMLHLAGYDHERRPQRTRMEALERRYTAA